MIDVERLTKTFGPETALSDVEFRVPKGSVVGLLGRNGAGKTTTLRILAGVLRPTSGRISIDGLDVATEDKQCRARIGYLPELAPLYPELRVEEHLGFRAAQKGLDRPRRREAIERVLTQLGALPWRHLRCGHLSRGMRQRVGLADALLTDPPVLLLDEPTTALDPHQRRETRDLIRQWGQSKTIILSSHILSEVESVCDSAIVIDQGTVIAQGTLTELLGRSRTVESILLLRGGLEPVRCALGDLDSSVVEIAATSDELVRVVLTAQDTEALDGLTETATSAVVRHGIAIREVSRQSASLERLFSELTEREGAP